MGLDGTGIYEPKDKTEPLKYAGLPGKMQTLGTNPKDLLGTDKVPLSRIPAVAILHEGMAMGNGGDKYGPYNWRDNAVQADIYIDACLRHILSWFDSREEVATDSGVHHLGHARACLGILLDAQATGNLIDNRPHGGKANKVLEELNETRKKYRKQQKEPQKTAEEQYQDVLRRAKQERESFRSELEQKEKN